MLVLSIVRNICRLQRTKRKGGKTENAFLRSFTYVSNRDTISRSLGKIIKISYIICMYCVFSLRYKTQNLTRM